MIYGIVIVLAGFGLLAAAWSLVGWLHRRFRVPYALLTVGVMTYIGALMAQVLVLQLLDRALLGILPVGALAFGIVAGFGEEIARFLGFQFLARSTTTRPQALMIGAGHGLTSVIYTALIAFGVGLSLIADGPDTVDDVGAVVSRTLAEAANSLLPVVMHMALSWLVLQVFLRGQLYWLFWAIFAHAVAEMTATLIGPGDSWAVVAWRAVVALVSLGVIFRLHVPGDHDASVDANTPDAA